MNTSSATRDRDASLAIFLALGAAGILALAAGLIFHYERSTMVGIAIGCIPTGILGAAATLWTSRWAERNHPDWLRRKANELDERRLAIRLRGGYAAFWTCFVYLGLYTLLSNTQFVRGLSHRTFGIASLCILLAVYWAAVSAYSRKY